MPNFEVYSDLNGAIQVNEKTSNSLKAHVFANQSAPIAIEVLAAKSFEATV